MNISHAILDFKDLSQNASYTMDRINWWLLKYKSTYEELRELIPDPDCPICQPRIYKINCQCHWGSLEESFLNLYETLDMLTVLHAKESYFKKELDDYEKIKNDPSKVLLWINKSECLVEEQFILFFIDYLGEDENCADLCVSFLTRNNPDIHVQRSNFYNTIKFLDIFNELYWV